MGEVSRQEFLFGYRNRFQVVRATTPALLDHAHRLRYQVYCVENSYENPDEHRYGRETDIYDDRSVHALLIHRRSGEIAGTVRVIFPGGVNSASLPIYTVLKENQPDWLRNLPYWSTAEISRFAVSKEFLSRLSGADDRQMFRYMTIGLMRGALEICRDSDIHCVGALMERALIRLLRGLGVIFEHVGSAVDYHGARFPCVSTVSHLVEHAPRGSLWHFASHMAAPLLEERAA